MNHPRGSHPADGDDTLFSSSHDAGATGGALHSTTGSNGSWGGDGILFRDNFADLRGGVVYATDATVSGDGDGTLFGSDHAGVEGGAIAAHNSAVSWDVDGTICSKHAADARGGATDVRS